MKVFERWQIPAAKLKQSAPGMPAGDIVAKGEAQIGFQQISELMPVKGIDYVGPIPEEIQHVTIFFRGKRVRTRRTLRPPRSSRDSSLQQQWSPIFAKHGLDPA